MFPRLRLVATLAVLVPAGCSQGATTAGPGGDGGTDAVAPECAAGFLGTPGQPIELSLFGRGTDGGSFDIADGGRVPLILPPQGGRIVLIGVRATNLSACAAKITGSFRDLANQEVRVDGRTVNLEREDGGWGASSDSDVSSFSNIPMCPNQWASTDVFEEPFELTVTLSDVEGHSASKTIRAVPFCGEPENAAECTCLCRLGYVLGQTCSADAGTDR